MKIDFRKIELKDVEGNPFMMDGCQGTWQQYLQ